MAWRACYYTGRKTAARRKRARSRKMKYQEFIKRNINSVCEFKNERGRNRELFDAYANPSREKEHIYNFLNDRVVYGIYSILEGIIDKYGYRMYIDACGVSTASKFVFNYSIRYKIFHLYTDSAGYIDIVFTKDNMYIMFEGGKIYRFTWDYMTNFGYIFRNWVDIPFGGAYER